MTTGSDGITDLRLHEHRTITAEVSGRPDMAWARHENTLRPDRIVVVMERVERSPWLVTGIRVEGMRVLASGKASINRWQRGANDYHESWTAEPDHEARRRWAVKYSGIPEWALDFAARWCAVFNTAETSDSGVSLLRGIADVEAGRVQRLDGITDL